MRQKKRKNRDQSGNLQHKNGIVLYVLYRVNQDRWVKSLKIHLCRRKMFTNYQQESAEATQLSGVRVLSGILE